MPRMAYWRDSRVQALSDEALIELVLQLEALQRNRRVQENPELLEFGEQRLRVVLDEIATRAQQLHFW